VSALGADVESRLRRLEDTHEIWAVIASFRRHIDARDFASLASLFSENGYLISILGPPVRGPAAIEALLEASLERNPESKRTYHHVTNPVITVDGDGAAALSNWCYVDRNENDKPEVALAGHYDDVFVREGPSWKFLRRTIYVDIPYTPLDINEQ
jgi:ketosteroid isomerase-like protein